jgi:uncharacterized MAPEG superfamily protein
MTIAYWCVLAAALLPYVFTGFAKTGRAESRRYDNHAPREWLDRLTGWRRRAHWAQLNAFEAFPPFAAAVIIAHLAGAAQARIDDLAVAFVALRVGHGALYILDHPRLRSLAWAFALGCVIGLFVIAARAHAAPL